MIISGYQCELCCYIFVSLIERGAVFIKETLQECLHFNVTGAGEWLRPIETIFTELKRVSFQLEYNLCSFWYNHSMEARVLRV